jgi:amino acid adenylation domain-containing protein
MSEGVSTVKVENMEREEELTQAGEVCAVAAVAEEIEGFRLSPQQRRVWRLQQEVSTNVYRAQCAAEIEGDLDPDRLENAIRSVVRRNEILRTAFHRQPGYKLPVQVITADSIVSIRTVDLTACYPHEQEERFARFYCEEGERAFDFTRAPLLRLLLLKLSAQTHILIITLPALCADARTLDNLVKMLGHAYARAATASADEDGEATQYVQFSEWQNELLDDEEAVEGLAFWRSFEPATMPPLALPSATTQSGDAAFAPAVWVQTFDEVLVAQVQAAARRYDASVAAFLQACWQTLLWRLTGAPEIVVSTLDEGRKFEELHDALGLFAKWLPGRCRFHADYRFSEILRQSKQCLFEAEEWQEYFNWETIGQSGDGSEQQKAFPEFGFEYREEGGRSFAAGLSFFVRRQDVWAERFDLKLACTGDRGALNVAVYYNSATYEAADIKRLAAEFHTLLSDAAHDPEKSISRLEVLGQDERRQLLFEFNDTRTACALDASLHELVEEQAGRTPDHVAVTYEEQQLTYAELNLRANQLAHHLRGVGVRAGMLVGICLERSVEMVVALLGVLKAGAAYVPIDPEYPRERIGFMLDDAAAPVLLTQQRLIENLPPHEAAVFALDAEEGIFDGQRTDNPQIEINPHSAAYAIYTSGSTGQPKGAVVTHANICNHMLWMQQEFPLGIGDSVLQKTPFSFDASVWEFYAPLMSGARLVIARPGGHQDPAYLIKLIAEQEVSTLQVVPTLLRALVETAGLESCRKLRRLFCGGEALTSEPVTRLKERLPEVEVYNLYGPTEATIDATFWRCDAVGDALTQPIGCPVANMQAYVLDRNRQLLPVGVAGELYLGGAGVGLGYLNRPELTAEKFIPNSFSHDPGTRLYRTGDLARFTPGGYLEYLGRVDHQVKIRGYRIELGEIEAALRQHPAIQEAVVLAREESAGDKRLVAYIINEPQLKSSLKELRSFMNERLPDYMVPQAFVLLDKLPLMPNGKVDRRALPAPEELESAQAEGFTAPRTPAEEMVTGIWAEVLGVERVGVRDNFFELGGHSLLGTQIISRVREAFRVEVALRHLFESPTVAEFASCIEAALRRQQDAEQPPLVRVSRDQKLPLSFAQQRLWFIDQLEPQTALYNIPAAVRLSGQLDIPALEGTLSEIVRRHEVLRTTFTQAETRPIQVINAAMNIKLPVADLRGLTETEREAEVARLAGDEARRPFDLSEGPLLRAGLLKLADDEHVALLTMHHIVSDGWSMGILVHEISALYEAFTQGQPSPLSELKIQYADFAAWQRQWLRGEALERQLSYWREQLKDAPPVLQLPTDRVRPSLRTYRGAREAIIFPAELSGQLKALSRREGATLFMTLLAAFQILLSRSTGQTDIVVGTDVANRNNREIEPLIGFFVNQLVLRTNLSGNPTFRELLARVRQVALEAYAHQDLPFEKLVEAVNPEREASVMPLFQTKLVLQNVPANTLEVSGLMLRELATHDQPGLAKYDLLVTLTEAEDALRGAVEYSSELFEARTIARLVRHFEELLHRVIRQPDARLDELHEALIELDRQQDSLERKELKQATLQKFENVRRKAVSRT